MAKKREYSPEEIEQILAENTQLKKQAEVDATKAAELRAKAKESGAYKKAYERHKVKMQTDSEYAAKVKERQKAYGQKSRAKAKELNDKLKAYEEKFGKL